MLKKFKNPLISIIIRTKNEERWIKALMRSLSSQNYQKYEIIIVDNCSEDKTLDIAKKYTVQKVIHITEYNFKDSIEQAVENADGDICVFLSVLLYSGNARLACRVGKTNLCAQSICSYGRQILLLIARPITLVILRLWERTSVTTT